MAISTYKVFLMRKPAAAAAYEKVIDIKDYPDLGGAPELLDTTTLSDKATTGIPGIQNTDALAFTGNYTKADYAKVKALEGKEEDYAVWFGGEEQPDGTVTPTGSDGKFKFKGSPSVYVNGGGVNEVVNMTVTIAAATPITPDEDDTPAA